MRSTPWTERPVEEARLLNPAFVGELVTACSRAYEDRSGQGLPYALAFVAVPIVLHKATRETLPVTTRTSLGAWLADHPDVHVGFAERTKTLVPFVKEAILLCIGGGLVSFEGTRLVALRSTRSRTRLRREATEEVRTCIDRAGFVGKWFAGAGDYTTIMSLWGVTP